MVFQAGDPGDALYLIVSGEVEVIDEDGPREHVVAVLGPGEFFGEMALLGEPRRTATVRCLTGVSAIQLDAGDFRILVGAVPRLQERFAESIRRRSADRSGEGDHVGVLPGDAGVLPGDAGRSIRSSGASPKPKRR